MTIVSIPKPRKFAFFSQLAHEKTSGQTTVEFRDTSSGEAVKANYVGTSIDGYPGFVEYGTIVRPPHHETYVGVGEIGPGKLELVKRPRPRPFIYHSLSDLLTSDPM